MARRPRTTDVSTRARWLAGVLVAVVAVATVLLVVLAIERTRPVQTGQSADPVPTFTFGAPPSAVPEPAPAPSTPAPDAAPAGPAERFLSIGSNALWRGVAGDCRAGIAPSIERSTDAGASWTAVTPTYRDIRQLVSLDAFAQTEAEIVASMGEDCETQALRTFTQGRFWDSYPDVLAASRYLDPADPTAVVTPQGRLVAPCAEPTDVRAQGQVVVLVCDGTAYELAAGSWEPLPIPDVRAAAVAAGDILLASVESSCPGVALTRMEGGDAEPAGCAPDADPAAPLAIAGTADQVRLWSGDAILALP